MRRPDSQQWRTAKASGDDAELAVAEWFIAKGYSVAKSLGRASYDLLAQCHIEVKHDRLAAQTGRIAVEIGHRGQPSGLLTTQATWWAIVVGREAMLMRTDTLRRCVMSGRYATRQGGDRMASELVLVPLADIRALEGVHVIELGEVRR